MNKYKNIQQNVIEGLFPPSRDPEKVEGAFDGGLVLNRYAQLIQLNESPDLDRVRLLQDGLRQDYEPELLGSAAAARIIAVGEHRFVVTGDDIFELVFRVYKDSGDDILIQILSGGSWAAGADGGDETPDVEVEDVLLSWKSYFDSVFFADGEHLIRWDRQSDPSASAGDDFPTTNELTAVDDEVVKALTISSTVLGNRFLLNYTIALTLTTGSNMTVTLGFYHEGTLVGTKEYSKATAGTATYPEEFYEMVRAIANGDEVSIKIEDITVEDAEISAEEVAFVDDTHFVQMTAEKITTPEADGDTYTYRASLTYAPGTGTGSPTDSCTIRYEYSTDGMTFNVLGSVTYSRAYLESVGDEFGAMPEVTWVIPGMGNGAKFRMVLTADNFLSDFVDVSAGVTWNASAESASVSVHGMNLATDGDPYKGITWTEEGGSIVNDLYYVDDGAASPSDIVCRFIGIFANRVVALQADQDPQKVKWPVNGDPDDWVGDGSGESILESRSDPIDELYALEPLSANTAALFRRRSIMRCVQTGIVEPALAFYPWLENFGTESPFSVAVVPGGLLFLSHDRNVYYLTEAGPVPVATPIQEELDSLISDPFSVEGKYNPKNQDYTLTTPGANLSWVFDFGLYQTSGGQLKIWHRNTTQMTRPAIIDGKFLYFADQTKNVYNLNLESIASSAYWTSPTLNRQNRNAEYTLERVIVRYRADDDTNIIIRASGDGGQTWEDGIRDDPDIAGTEGNQRRAIQTFNINGYDLRFRIDLPDDEEVRLLSWRAYIVERDEIGFE